jgi:hypothetical protein
MTNLSLSLAAPTNLLRGSAVGPEVCLSATLRSRRPSVLHFGQHPLRLCSSLALYRRVRRTESFLDFGHFHVAVELMLLSGLRRPAKAGLLLST